MAVPAAGSIPSRLIRRFLLTARGSDFCIGGAGAFVSYLFNKADLPTPQDRAMKFTTIALATAFALSASSLAFAQTGDGGGTGNESAQMSGGFASYGTRGFAGANDAWISRGSRSSSRAEMRPGVRKSHYRNEQR